MRTLRFTSTAAGALALALAGLALSAGAGGAAAPSNAALEARLRQLEDYQQIQRLNARYMIAEDSNHWADYANCFARNGELIFQKFRYRGRAEIQSKMEAAMNAPGSVLKTNGLRHSLSNLDLKIGGDRAASTARWIVMSRQPDGRPKVGATGHVDDILVREDGEWKFQRRVIFTDFPFDDPIATQGIKD
jgi:hypothetical protein